MKRIHRETGGVALLLAAACFVFFWNLTASGYANEFYSAAAQAASQSWSAFLWGSLDAGGAITVDKPPASIWLMALSVRAFGLNSFAILLPQALMGVASTALLYRMAARAWGHRSGMVCGLIFITTPVAALMFRFNNPDALLILLSLLASDLVIRAITLAPTVKHANARRSALYTAAGLCCGFGFLTKQLQVLLVVPGFGLAMLFLTPTTVRRRLLDSVIALGSMVLGAGWWVLLTVIVPSGSRPYIGGSQTDSFIELTFSYNGFGRLTGDETGSVVPGGGGTNGSMWGETGLLRLFGSDFADQFSWLAPIALAGLALAVALFIKHMAQLHAAQKTGSAVALTANERVSAATLTVMGSWLFVTWVVFSLMAGIFHAYYTVALAPAIAIMGAFFLHVLVTMRNRVAAQTWAAAFIAIEGIWCFSLVMQQVSFRLLAYVILFVSIAASIALLILAWLQVNEPARQRLHTIARIVCALACVAILAGPATWTWCTISTGHTGSLPSAGPSGMMDDGAGRAGNPGGGGGGSLLNGTNAEDELVSLLTKNASNYRWAAATTGSQNAASYQLASGLSIIAIGGFNGSDPAPTLEEFQSYVEQDLVRYYIASDGMGGTQQGGSDAASQIAAWVQENFTAQTVGSVTVYDLTQ